MHIYSSHLKKEEGLYIGLRTFLLRLEAYDFLHPVRFETVFAICTQFA